MIFFYSTIQSHLFLWLGNCISFGLVYLLQYKLMFSSPLNIKPWSIVGKGFYSPLVFRKLASVWFVFFILNCFFFRGFEFLSIAGNLELSQKGVTWFFLSFNIGFSILLAFSFSNLSFLYGKEVIDFFF